MLSISKMLLVSLRRNLLGDFLAEYCPVPSGDNPLVGILIAFIIFAVGLAIGYYFRNKDDKEKPTVVTW